MAPVSRKLVIARFRGGIMTALFEDDVCAVLNYEPESGGDAPVGGIYVGRVKNIVKNLSAAFVDIGTEKPGFLALKEGMKLLWADGREHDRLREGDELLIRVAKASVKTKGPVLHAGFRGENDRALLSRASHVKAPALLVPAVPLWRLTAEHLMRQWKKDRAAGPAQGAPAGYEAPQENEADGAEDTPAPPECVTDIPEAYEALSPVFGDGIRLYEDSLLPLKSLFALEARVSEATGKNVWLKSGGYLVIEPTEAMTVIDVNTGKADLKLTREELILRTDLEAAAECARQIRLRNLSGMILIDFIDLKTKEAEEAVKERLAEALSGDPVETHFVDMTALFIAEIVRKKTGKPLREQLQAAPAQEGSRPKKG